MTFSFILQFITEKFLKAFIIIEGPLFGKPGALMAELDLEEIPQAKLDFDVNGHYSRDDIFKFSVLGQPEIKKE